MIISLPTTQSWGVVKITLFEVMKLTSEIVSSKLLQEANHCTCEKHPKQLSFPRIRKGMDMKRVGVHKNPNSMMNATIVMRRGIGKTSARSVRWMRKQKIYQKVWKILQWRLYEI